MTQLEEALATKPDGLNLIPETYMVGRRTRDNSLLLQVSSELLDE